MADNYHASSRTELAFDRLATNWGDSRNASGVELSSKTRLLKLFGDITRLDESFGRCYLRHVDSYGLCSRMILALTAGIK
jgi:hypothetical protein